MESRIVLLIPYGYTTPCSIFLFSEDVIPVMRVVEKSFFFNRVESQNLISGVDLQQWWLNVVPMHCLWHVHVAFCTRSGSDEIPQVWEFIVFLQSVPRLLVSISLLEWSVC